MKEIIRLNFHGKRIPLLHENALEASDIYEEADVVLRVRLGGLELVKFGH